MRWLKRSICMLALKHRVWCSHKQRFRALRIWKMNAASTSLTTNCFPFVQYQIIYMRSVSNTAEFSKNPMKRLGLGKMHGEVLCDVPPPYIAMILEK